MDTQQTFDHCTETLRVAWMRLANARESGGDISEFQKAVREAQADRLLAFSEWLVEQGGELPPQPVAGGRDVGSLRRRPPAARRRSIAGGLHQRRTRDGAESSLP